jgi:uncharacterized protein YlaI
MNYFTELNDLKEIKRFLDWFLESQGFCVICGHDDPLDMEKDHIGARANSPVLISLCRNCHGRKSIIQRRSWLQGWSDKNKPNQIKAAFVILGLSCLLRLKYDQMMLEALS